jgi:hypothetical protein
VRLHATGDRGNRRHARLKYVIAERGEDGRRAASGYSADLGPEEPDFAVPIIWGGMQVTASSISARCQAGNCR